jgi:hypothetical protein
VLDANNVGPAFSIDWTLADNTVRTLSQADMVNVGLAMGQHIQTQFSKARSLRSQIGGNNPGTGERDRLVGRPRIAAGVPFGAGRVGEGGGGDLAALLVGRLNRSR